MNFGLNETQADVSALAADLFSRRVSPDRLEKVEVSDDRFDRELWSALAESGLLGVVVPEAHGGLGFGAVEAALVLEQLGRAVAAVPLLPTVVGAAAIAGNGDQTQQQRLLPRIVEGSAVLALALPPSTAGVTVDGTRLSGDLVGVAWAHVAEIVVAVVGEQVVLLDPSAGGVTATRVETTAREVALNLSLDHAQVELLGDATTARLVISWARTGLAAVQAGVTDAALRLTASYTSQREQFGKPLSTFQGVALKAADAYLDATAVRAAALQAAWSLDEPGLDPALAVLTAAWWAAEGGQDCVHLTQHLHGGMGADVTYPVHRYFLWGKQIELMLGGASALLAELGDALASQDN
jgi:alkylation response protein AidB-like acyl-CoA dehydrogenase